MEQAEEKLWCVHTHLLIKAANPEDAAKLAHTRLTGGTPGLQEHYAVYTPDAEGHEDSGDVAVTNDPDGTPRILWSDYVMEEWGELLNEEVEG